MYLTVFSFTHPGHQREQNEDAILVENNRDYWLLADGMGGHAGGKEASAIAVAKIKEALDSGDGLLSAFHSANAAVIARSKLEPSLKGMGSTIVALVKKPFSWQFAWLGDSRLYHWDTAKLTQLTTDHSFVQDMLQRGVLKADELRDHPTKNIITKAIGMQAQLNINSVLHRFYPTQSGIFLLCSDGLSDMLDDASISQLFSTHRDVNQLGCALQQSVLATTAPDNISFILVQYQQNWFTTAVNQIHTLFEKR